MLKIQLEVIDSQDFWWLLVGRKEARLLEFGK